MFSSLSALALDLNCEFDKTTIKSSQVTTNRGFNESVSSGFLNIKLEDKKDYLVSFSVIPKNTSFSIGTALVPKNSKISYDTLSPYDERLLSFSILRNKVKIGKLTLGIGPDQKNFQSTLNRKEMKIGLVIK